MYNMNDTVQSIERLAMALKCALQTYMYKYVVLVRCISLLHVGAL